MHPLFTDFHFSRLFKGDTYEIAVARHEHYVFSHLNLKPKMSVLEVNCGTGNAALELAEFSGVYVVGIDPDARKIEQAKKKSRARGLSTRVVFMRGDVTCLRTLFQESSFHGIYCIEAMKSSPNFEVTYEDLCHLLRPGGRLAIYEWCWTNEMDPSNVDHQRLAELLQVATGIENRSISERSFDTVSNAMRTCHLQVEYQEDLSKLSSRAKLPWYTPLDNALCDSRVRWPATSLEEGQFGRLTKNAAEILSMAGHLQLFTPMALFVARRET